MNEFRLDDNDVGIGGFMEISINALTGKLVVVVVILLFVLVLVLALVLTLVVLVLILFVLVTD